MRAYRLKTRLESGKPLVVELPPDAPPGQVEVIVLLADAPASPMLFASMAEFNAWLRQQPPSGRSRAEIDRDIAEERASWD